MNTIKIEKRNTKMVAHRGVSGLETENSNFAFVAAGSRSYFGVETDVHVTKDGKFIIIHDDVTGRVSETNIPVEGSTFEELRKVRLRERTADGLAETREDIFLPTLEDYVKICKKYEKVCVLELKNRMRPEEIYEIADVISGLDYFENVIFISFDLDNLVDLRKKYPKQPAMFLCSDIEEGGIGVLKAHNLGIDIHYGALFNHEGLFQMLKDNGITINCWTVDDPEAAEVLTKMGVDMITSNILE